MTVPHSLDITRSNSFSQGIQPRRSDYDTYNTTTKTVERGLQTIVRLSELKKKMDDDLLLADLLSAASDGTEDGEYRLMYHGTSVTNAISIMCRNTQQLVLRPSIMQGLRFGKGFYLTRSFSEASQYGIGKFNREQLQKRYKKKTTTSNPIFAVFCFEIPSSLKIFFCEPNRCPEPTSDFLKKVDMVYGRSSDANKNYFVLLDPKVNENIFFHSISLVEHKYDGSYVETLRWTDCDKFCKDARSHMQERKRWVEREGCGPILKQIFVDYLEKQSGNNENRDSSSRYFLYLPGDESDPVFLGRFSITYKIPDTLEGMIENAQTSSPLLKSFRIGRFVDVDSNVVLYLTVDLPWYFPFNNFLGISHSAKERASDNEVWDECYNSLLTQRILKYPLWLRIFEVITFLFSLIAVFFLLIVLANWRLNGYDKTFLSFCWIYFFLFLFHPWFTSRIALLVIKVCNWISVYEVLCYYIALGSLVLSLVINDFFCNFSQTKRTRTRRKVFYVMIGSFIILVLTVLFIYLKNNYNFLKLQKSPLLKSFYHRTTAIKLSPNRWMMVFLLLAMLSYYRTQNNNLIKEV